MERRRNEDGLGGRGDFFHGMYVVTSSTVRSARIAGVDQAALEDDGLYIQLLGSFRLAVGGRVVEESAWPLRKTRNVIELLALARGHRMHRGELMDLLWSELTPEAAANNLHKAIYLLRRVLEPGLQPRAPSSYVHARGDSILLDAPGPLHIDVEAFEAAAAVALSTGDPGAYERALALYAGDLLPEDRYEDWVTGRRERLRSRRLELLLGLARLEEQRGDVGAAIDTLRQVMSVEPAHEDACARLMRLLAQNGQRYLALREYHQLREAMRRELDAEPDARTRALYQRILGGQLAPSAQGGSTRLPSVDASAVRSGGAPLIGREHELASLHERLEGLCRGQSGFILIRGEAGIGKSRLLAEVIDRASHFGVPTLWDNHEKYVESRSQSPFAGVLAIIGARLRDAMGDVPAAAPTTASNGGAGKQRRRLSDVVDVLVQLDGRDSLLLVLDDVHLTVDSTLDRLHDLVSEGRNAPVLVLGSFRPEQAPAGSSVCRLAEKLEQEGLGAILDVSHFDLRDTELLVSHLLGAPVDRGTVETVYDLARGNPYYTQEAVGALRGRGQISYMGGMWCLDSRSSTVVKREHLRQPENASGANGLASYLRSF